MQQAAEVLNVPYDQIEWRYFGLNHRGFIYEAKHRGTDLISLMPAALGRREIGNINAATIGELKSIPLKYFRLVQDRTYLPPRRASELIRLRKQVAKELSQSPQMSPPSLTERYMEWYPLSLVPLIQSLQSNCPQQHVLSIRDSSPVLFERQVMVSKNRIEWTEPENIPAAASRWLDVFQRHEEQFLQTVRSPLQSNVEEALDLDPTIESFRVKTAAQRLWAEYKTRKRQESITCLNNRLP
jgi:alpha-galactosidase/6-phospho-beta-glucosidase family protein